MCDSGALLGMRVDRFATDTDASPSGPPEVWSRKRKTVVQQGEQTAEEGNRTLTPLRAQRPERCVSTSSTTSARLFRWYQRREVLDHDRRHEAAVSYRAALPPSTRNALPFKGTRVTNASAGV